MAKRRKAPTSDGKRTTSRSRLRARPAAFRASRNDAERSWDVPGPRRAGSRRPDARRVRHATQIAASDRCGISRARCSNPTGVRDRGRRKRRGVAAAGRRRVSRASRTRTLSSSINIATSNRSESSDAMVPAADGCTSDSKCAKRTTGSAERRSRVRAAQSPEPSFENV